MKSLYLELDKQGIVVGVSEMPTDNVYGEVDDTVLIEDVEDFLGIHTKRLKWENDALVEADNSLIVENALLKQQVLALNERIEFQEDLIQEMAMKLYE